MKVPKTTLEQWCVVQAIVDLGGFAQAAQALHRSQSSVSYMVARLQEALGVELLRVVGRKAKLTKDGTVLLMRARQLLGGALELEQLAYSLKQGWEAEIRLVVDVAFPTSLLLQVLRALAPLAPHTRVQLQEVVLSGADEALLSQSADLVIGTRVPPGFLGDLLMDVEFIAVAHPDHPLHRLGRELLSDDLERELQIVVRDSGTRAPRDEGWLGAAQRWTVTADATSVAAVSAGLGFAWLPSHLIREQLNTGVLKALPLQQGQHHKVSLYLIFAQPELAGPGTRKLAELIRNAAAKSLSQE